MAIRLFRALAAFAVGCWGLTGIALAESRVALIVGNAAYKTAAPLANPINDAKAVAAALGDAGFEVQLVTDLSQTEMRRALRDFAANVVKKGKDTVALIYYAGHGLQIDGENFLVPIDAKFEREADVAIETMRLADMMNTLSPLPASMRIVILDACRNNPFAALRKSTGRGLAIVDAPAGSIVAYATAPGQEALDGAGAANSPYTAALVEAMRQPNLQIEQMFKNVRVKVNAVTGGKQVPWENSSLTKNFAFFGTPPASPPAVVAIAPTPPTAVPTPRAAVPTAPVAESAQPAAPQAPAAPVVVANTEFSAIAKAKVESIKTLSAEKAYDVVIEQNTVEAFEEFIRIYPKDPRCRQIRILLNRRNQMVAWRNAVVSNTAEAYDAYLDLYPESDHVSSARRLRIQPRLRPIDTVIARPIHLPISRLARITGAPSSLNILNGGSRPALGGPGRNNGIGSNGRINPGQGGRVVPAQVDPGQGGRVVPAQVDPGRGGRVVPAQVGPGQGGRVVPAQVGPGQGDRVLPAQFDVDLEDDDADDDGDEDDE
jgi:hypothetical protein